MTEVVLKDRVKEISTTIGAGSMTLDGAVQGFQSFAAIGNGNLTFYTIANATQWEVGIGMYLTSGPTLERNVVLDSSNNGALVSWTSGEKEVFVTYPSSIADYTPPSSVFEYLTQAFTGTGSLGSVTAFSPSVEYLVVAGGGAGSCNANGGGGGGAGGFRTGVGFNIATATNYTVTVGAGGTGTTGAGTNGGNSVFSTITSAGGGGGKVSANGTAGGSGSGAPASSAGYIGGAGNTPATTPSQGNNGGNNNTAAPYPGGGGGGAGAVGGNGSGSQSGAGGVGQSSTITGTLVTYAGGGGGGGTVQGALGGAGGTGGGGAGGNGTTNGTAGTANTGGGSGGGGNDGSRTVANGGSGVVILKYADSLTISNPGGGLTFSTSTAVSGFKITTFTAGTGNVQWSL